MEVTGYMKYTPYYTNKIKKQLKFLKKRGYNMVLFKEVVEILLDGVPLPTKYSDHPLRGEKQGYRDCHIRGDWVLIYKIEKNILKLILSETGTHADILE